MKAIDQIVGFKAQRVKVPKTISSGYNLTLIVSRASSPQYFNTYKLFLQPVIFLKRALRPTTFQHMGFFGPCHINKK